MSRAPRCRCTSVRRFALRLRVPAKANGSTAGTTVFEDESVRIWHQQDDVLILSLKTKMHVIGAGVIAGLAKAIDEAEKNYKGLVLWSADAADGGAFSAGADLQSMLPLFMSGGTKAIEPEVAKLQQAHQAMKYANVPVVAAVAGLALGGGCELAMHAARRVVSIESYMGLGGSRRRTRTSRRRPEGNCGTCRS